MTTMFAITEAEAAAIRAVFEARTIAGWKPLPLRPVKRMPKTPPLRRVR